MDGFPISKRQQNRLTGALLVAGLHILFVTGLLTMNFAKGVLSAQPAAPPVMEVILPHTPLPQRSTAPSQGAEQNGTSFVPRDFQSPFAAPSAAASALGTALFRCAPEHMGELSAEERLKCERMGGFSVTAFINAPKYFAPKPDKLSNSDIAARERNTADPCAIAKMSQMAGAECYHEIIYGKALP